MHAVGGGLGRGYSINVPWDTAAEKYMPGDAAYDHAFRQVKALGINVQQQFILGLRGAMDDDRSFCQ